MNKLQIKTPQEIEIMKEGGKKLAKVKENLRKKVKANVRASDIEELAVKLIKIEGGKPSFKMVPGYLWATCVNVNSGLVHGIPKPEIVFKKGDVVSVDVGMFYKGFHTDTSFTAGIETTPKTDDFLETGRAALKKAISKARAGNRIFDISKAIEETVEAKGYSPIQALVGHGVGRELHEEPQIPCFTYGKRKNSPKIQNGAVLAIEVMYAEGKPGVSISPDGWTISMADGKISALFEETIAVGKNGPMILT